MKNEQENKIPTAYLIGIGMGGPGQLTGFAALRLKEAGAVAGAKRVLKSVESFLEGKPVFQSYEAEKIGKWLDGQRKEIGTAAVVFSGDTGFYSGAGKVKEYLEKSGWQAVLIPGISSVSYLSARLGIPWQDAKIISLHGRKENYLNVIRENSRCFLLLGEHPNAGEICKELWKNGLGECRISFGSCLSYEEEQIYTGTVKQLLEREEESLKALGNLVCCFVENPFPRQEKDFLTEGFSLKDESFIRGNVPMTKEEIRTLSLAKLRLYPGACLYDIGSGTGSVAIAAGRILEDRDSRIFAVEKNPEGLELIEKNRQKLIPSKQGFTIVPGEAPEALLHLPAPTHGFIGGSGGKLLSILETLLKKNPGIRIVITAITLETLSECLKAMKQWEFARTEIIQAGIVRTAGAGPYHMQKAENPVYIITLEGSGRQETGEEKLL